MGISRTCITLKPGRHGAGTFMPGDMVRGAVIIYISGSSPCKLSDVTLKVKGQARTHWTTHNGTWSTRHSQKESFLKLVLSILGVGKDAPTALPPGENHLNFSFTLPDRLPHSHEYSHGEVVYKLVAHAVSSQHWSWNGTNKIHFTVLQRRDLRTMPQLARRLVVERKTKCVRRDDPGEFTITLARQGFVPGDTIDIYVRGTDEVLSALARSEGLVKLKRFEEFRAGSSTQQHKPVLVKKRLGMDPDEWRHFQLTMPKDDIGIDPDVCHIIAVSHYVKIWDVHLPVTLGTIPFGKRSSSRPPSRTPSGAPLAPSSQTSSRAPSRSPSGVALAPLSQTPSRAPSLSPSGVALALLSQTPSRSPSGAPLAPLSQTPSRAPSRSPSGAPLAPLSQTPSRAPSRSPSGAPLAPLSQTPSRAPSRSPSGAPLAPPSQTPSRTPSTQLPSDQTPSGTSPETPISKTPSSQTSSSDTSLPQTPLSQTTGNSEMTRPTCRTTDV